MSSITSDITSVITYSNENAGLQHVRVRSSPETSECSRIKRSKTISLTFRVGRMGLRRTRKTPISEMMEVTTITHVKKELASSISNILETFQRNLLLIGQRMEWKKLGKTPMSSVRVSKQEIMNNRKNENYKHLDWSSLDLDFVPHLIGRLKFTETLNLSNNSITVLPKELEAMRALRKIILIGNPIAALPLPKWCEDLKWRVTFVMEDLSDREEWAQADSPRRIDDIT